MIIEPKIRGFICTTAHPAGCFQSIQNQVDFVKSKGMFSGPKNVLVIGGSTGYGLASAIVPMFASGANVISVFFEKEPSDKRTATAGWYNTAALEVLAKREGFYMRSINGDAFSQDIKRQTAELIRNDLKKIDLVVYSLASPRRTHPITGETYSSVLKPIGRTYTNKTVDAFRGEVKEITIEPATQAEIDHTIAVMGGEDWEMWMDYLTKENLLADNVTTVAYSYIGPELTHPIYKAGTIGKAKEHLEMTAKRLNDRLKSKGGQAIISVNKAVVTQASSAIPVVPLYISILFKIMKDFGTHEGVIEQIYRLFKDHLYAEKPLPRDEGRRIRIDDLEMEPRVQEKIKELWQQVNTDNIESLTDIRGYREDFQRLFGFCFPDVDYSKDIDPDIRILSLKDKNVETIKE